MTMDMFTDPPPPLSPLRVPIPGRLPPNQSRSRPSILLLVLVLFVVVVFVYRPLAIPAPEQPNSGAYVKHEAHRNTRVGRKRYRVVQSAEA